MTKCVYIHTYIYVCGIVCGNIPKQFLIWAEHGSHAPRRFACCGTAWVCADRASLIHWRRRAAVRSSVVQSKARSTATAEQKDWLLVGDNPVFHSSSGSEIKNLLPGQWFWSVTQR